MPYKDIEAQRAAQRRYYERNKQQVKSAARERNNTKIKFVQQYKETIGCVDCGIKYPYWILELDHLPGFDKIAHVSTIVKHGSLEQVKEEIKKCEVVCSNCHKDRTHSRRVGSTGGAIRLEPDTPC